MASGGRCSRAQEYVPQRWQADGVRRTLADDFSFMCVDMTWRGPPPSLLFPCARAPGPAAPLAGPLALRRHARATAHRPLCVPSLHASAAAALAAAPRSTQSARTRA